MKLGHEFSSFTYLKSKQKLQRFHENPSKYKQFCMILNLPLK